MERRLRKLTRGVVVDDPHYINEVEYLQRLGFIVVRIDMRTNNKIAIGRALLDSSAGTVLLQEHFGNPPAYKADYVLTVSDRKGLYSALDGLMLKLTNAEEYNISEGSQEGPNSEVLYEEEKQPLNQSID